jgi:hypothetical protein
VASPGPLSTTSQLDFQPSLSREAIDLTKFRDLLHELDPLDPEIPNLNQRITDTISKERKKLWNEKVELSNPRDNPDKHGRLIRILSGKRPHQPPNQPIYFGNKCFSKPQAIARKFCQQFMSVGPHKTDRNSRRVIKNLKKKHQLDHSFKPFTPQLTKDAIAKSSNSTAVGSDGTSSLHLKFLGPNGISYLTDISVGQPKKLELPP